MSGHLLLLTGSEKKNIAFCFRFVSGFPKSSFPNVWAFCELRIYSATSATSAVGTSAILIAKRWAIEIVHRFVCRARLVLLLHLAFVFFVNIRLKPCLTQTGGLPNSEVARSHNLVPRAFLSPHHRT